MPPLLQMLGLFVDLAPQPSYESSPRRSSLRPCRRSSEICLLGAAPGIDERSCTPSYTEADSRDVLLVVIGVIKAVDGHAALARAAAETSISTIGKAMLVPAGACQKLRCSRSPPRWMRGHVRPRTSSLLASSTPSGTLVALVKMTASSGRQREPSVVHAPAAPTSTTDRSFVVFKCLSMLVTHIGGASRPLGSTRVGRCTASACSDSAEASRWPVLSCPLSTVHMTRCPVRLFSFSVAMSKNSFVGRQVRCLRERRWNDSGPKVERGRGSGLRPPSRKCLKIFNLPALY